MTQDEMERLNKIRGDHREDAKGVKGVMGPKLSYGDLLLLLREDATVRALVRAAADPDVRQPQGDPFPAPAPAGPARRHDGGGPDTAARPELPPGPHEQAAAAQPLGRELAPELGLLDRVRQDAELATALLAGVEGGTGRDLVCLIARAAQWNTVLDLWDRLAQRCREGKAPAAAGELEILAGCLAIHNAIWSGRQATFTHVSPGTAYDYRLHERGTPAGDVVRAEWLPGLVNAGGQVQKKPLVQT